jgi:tRNA threonylcarbamoyl adenosine modification protein (Sua5/YciO/YrdC/YwlC family)
MKTEILHLGPDDGAQAAAAAARDALAAGNLVVFPTETVYGLAASAAHPSAIKRLRELKGVAAPKSFTVHVGRRSDADRYVPDLSPVARRLMAKGWPGPITMLFKVGDPSRAAAFANLPSECRDAVFGDGSVGLRFPDDRFAAALLGAIDEPIVASSANRPGRATALTGADAAADLDGSVELIIDAGRTKYARPSTIVSLNGQGYQVARAGVFDERTIRRLAAFTLLFVCSGNTCRSPIAEAMARGALAKRLGCAPEELVDRGVIVTSAGTQGFAGGPASSEAVEVLEARGLQLRGHRSRPLTAELLRAADRVYAMSASHLAAIEEMDPEARQRAEPLDAEREVADPVGGTHEDYVRCADQIAAALERRLREIPV